jgi:hypothetical protein
MLGVVFGMRAELGLSRPGGRPARTQAFSERKPLDKQHDVCDR